MDELERAHLDGDDLFGAEHGGAGDGGGTRANDEVAAADHGQSPGWICLKGSKRHAIEGVWFFNDLDSNQLAAAQSAGTVTRNTHSEMAAIVRPAGHSASRDFPRILDSFAPGRHKFGHWRGRFGPRELLRR